MPQIECKMTIVEEDSPNRCQGMAGNRQCLYEKAPGGNYCLIHSANTNRAVERKEHRNYQLARIQADVDNKLFSPELKNLREEIALLRVMLEKVINGCIDDTDLLLASSKISDMVSKIQQLVTACHKIEVSSGILLDKGAVIQLANMFIAIIGKHVTDIDVIDAISKEIPLAVSQIEGNTNVSSIGDTTS
jgi:hypothetical protein